jgi:tetratricopeptide (TPR) repeat protein/SAM-dependent methyltransferase
MPSVVPEDALSDHETDLAFAKGLRLHESGDLNAARSVYNTIPASDPEHADALHLLGTALAQTGAFEEGIEALQAALDIDPDEPTFLLNYAEAQFCLGCQALADGALAEAKVSFSEALGSNPQHQNAQLNLGVVAYHLGDLEGAEAALSAVLEKAPQDTKALHNLGMVRRRKGDVPGSLTALWQAIRSDAENPSHWSTFSEAFQQARFSDSSDIDELLNTLLMLLARAGIDHRAMASQAVRLFRSGPALGRLIEVADTGSKAELDSALFDEGGIDALTRPVVRLAMERTILADLGIERLYTRIRSIALETFVSGRQVVPEPLIQSLATQCFMSGYVWSFGEEEVAQVEAMINSLSGTKLADDAENVMRISLLGCYVPLIEWERAEEVAIWAADLGSAELSQLVLQQIIEPFEESQLRELIPTYGESHDEVSQQVREQYEEHPYPRWTTAPYREPGTVADVLRGLAPAAAIEAADRIEVPSILVAGCGTGKHLIEVARRFQDSRVSGIDLSLASLAFATRKASELGLDDVQLMQADILELEDWAERFDIVDVSGVLHHMRDPVTGWRILSDLVRPGGFMRVGLYSERARQSVVEARDFIESEGLEPTADGIRAARAAVAIQCEDQQAGPQSWRDFFTMGECRDLLFHVQEHRFSLPQIREILEELGLDFVGFEFGGPETLASFRSAFPEPGTEHSLGAWHEYEFGHPHTFSAMYQFWVSKPAP